MSEIHGPTSSARWWLRRCVETRRLGDRRAPRDQPEPVEPLEDAGPRWPAGVFGDGAGGRAVARDTEKLIERLYARRGSANGVKRRRVHGGFTPLERSRPGEVRRVLGRVLDSA